jgi:succinate dehydrogenase/fumarate reductase-like Fe-S protein
MGKKKSELSKEKAEPKKVDIHIMGKRYEVPSELTIMGAMEYAGYKYTRGSGCRAGFCGACATIYRKKGDYKLYSNLACQTLVEDGMQLVQLPFIPAVKARYELDKIDLNKNVMLVYYPEIARCITCNTCNKTCPQDLSVMEFIQASLRGDLARAAELSFDCIQCGLCAARCPADIKHYHVGQLARRLYGKFLQPKSKELDRRIKEIESGRYKEEIDKLARAPVEELRKIYKLREIEGTE